MKEILQRDLRILLHKQSFWLLVALWFFIINLIYFKFFESFLEIQPKLIAKQSTQGITEAMLIPFIKTLAIPSVIFIASLCSRLFFYEKWADFSALHKSLNYSFLNLILAKLAYIIIFTFISLILICLPILITGIYFDFDFSRVILSLAGLSLLLVTTGILGLFFSQIFSQSIIVILVSFSCLYFLEILSKLTTEPIWLSRLLYYFSPISQFNHISSGILSSNNLLFFSSFSFLMIIIIRRNSSLL